MGLRDRLLAGPPTPAKPARPRAMHPKGWEPHVTTKSGEASAVIHSNSQTADERSLLLGSGLDPDFWRIIDGTIETRRWQQAPGDEWLYYYKFKAIDSRRGDGSDPGWAEAIALLAKHKPRRPNKRPVKHARIFFLSDTQIGKGAGGGSVALAERVEQFLNEAAAIVKAEKPDAVYILGLGDIVERCWGSYPAQQFTTDLDEREQERFARRMVLAAIKTLAPLAPRVVVGAIGGNHGQTRIGSGSRGEAFTTTRDNADIAVFEQAADAVAEAPAYDHVSFVFPSDGLHLTLDICGTILGITHGHVFGKGGSPQQKAVEWWKAQALGGHPIGEANVLVTGHFHSYQAFNTHGRMWFQCPSADGGSRWFRDATGEWSQPGFLTMSIDEKGIRDHRVLWSNHGGST